MSNPEVLAFLRGRFEANDVIKKLMEKNEDVEMLWIEYQNTELPKFERK